MAMRFNIAFGRGSARSGVGDEARFRLGNRQTMSYVSTTASVCFAPGPNRISSFDKHSRRHRALGKSGIVLSSMTFKETVSKRYM
jgi:hypothetical protein